MKKQKGITLIALIITIILMAILVSVSVTVALDGGLFRTSQLSAKETEKNAIYQQIVSAMKLTNEGKIDLQGTYDAAKRTLEVQGYTLGELQVDGTFEVTGKRGTYKYRILERQIIIVEEKTGGPETIPATTIAEAMQDNMLSKTVNSDIEDQYGNKITIPAGFKILVDETTTYTATNIDVTDGIVVTDGTNEFVWVPVGEGITNGEKTANITLGRYSNFVANSEGEYVPVRNDEVINYYQEIQTSELGNKTAINIENFVGTTTEKGGYYIARFEAGVVDYDENLRDVSGATKYITTEGKDPKLVSKKGEQVWDNVSQNKASSLCRKMYTNKPYTSDLINSYAWDTAIIFIQTFGECDNYATQNFTDEYLNTGISTDKYCNIYDMSGNAREWSTETPVGISYTPVATARGGLIYFGYTYPEGMDSAGTRTYYADKEDGTSFRPILYMEKSDIEIQSDEEIAIVTGEVKYENLPENLKKGVDTGKIYKVIKEESVNRATGEVLGTKIACIPTGFVEMSYSNIISNGLVVKDEADNEFVWIPVENAVLDLSDKIILSEEPCDASDADWENIKQAIRSEIIISSTTKYPMAAKVTVQKEGEQAKQSYVGIGYTFESSNGKINGIQGAEIREPFNITSEISVDENNNLLEAGIYKFDSQEVFSAYGGGIYEKDMYQKEFNEMVQQVENYGGFYVGRYETAQFYYDVKLVVKSGQGISNIAPPWTFPEWSNANANPLIMYKKQKDFASGSNIIGSSMIWGCQYDQVMNFVNGKKDGRGDTFNVAYGIALRASGKSFYGTGKNYVDRVANIYDLECNYCEITLERYLNQGFIYRGNFWYRNSSAGDPRSYSKCFNKKEIFRTS